MPPGERPPASTRATIGGRLRRTSGLELALLVAALLLPAYLATNTEDARQNRDAIASAVPAWSIAQRHTIDVGGFEEPWLTWTEDGIVQYRWYVRRPDGVVVSNRPPGAILYAVPFYWLGEDTAVPDLRAAAVAASIGTAAAMGVLALVFRRVTDTPIAATAALVAGLATPMWSVASDALWQHSVSTLWLASSLLALAAGRLATTGAFLGLAVLTRPLTAGIAATVGILRGVGERSLRPVAIIGALSGLGAAALVAYNRVMFTTSSPTGGYGSYPVENLTGYSIGRYLHNLVGLFFSPTHGILVYTPFVALLLIGLPAAWRTAPPWARQAAVAGVVYLLLQMRVNYFTGGYAFFSYRLPLEAMTMAAPLLLLSYRTWVRAGEARRNVFWALVVVSIALQAYGSTLFPIQPAV